MTKAELIQENASLKYELHKAKEELNRYESKIIQTLFEMSEDYCDEGITQIELFCEKMGIEIPSKEIKVSFKLPIGTSIDDVQIYNEKMDDYLEYDQIIKDNE